MRSRVQMAPHPQMPLLVPKEPETQFQSDHVGHAAEPGSAENLCETSRLPNSTNFLHGLSNGTPVLWFWSEYGPRGVLDPLSKPSLVALPHCLAEPLTHRATCMKTLSLGPQSMGLHPLAVARGTSWGQRSTALKASNAHSSSSSLPLTTQPAKSPALSCFSFLNIEMRKQGRPSGSVG